MLDLLRPVETYHKHDINMQNIPLKKKKSNKETVKLTITYVKKYNLNQCCAQDQILHSEKRIITVRHLTLQLKMGLQ